MSNLNSFEMQLLDDLKQRQPVHPHRKGIVLGSGGGVAAAIAAGIVALFTLTAAPAYAVDENTAGDITITLNSLKDAKGLEAELAKHGIDANVSYEAAGVRESLPEGLRTALPDHATPGASGSVSGSSGTSGTGTSGAVDEKTMKELIDKCGIDPSRAPKVDIEPNKAVIEIPRGSIPTDRELTITTSASDGFGSLSATWTSTDGICGMVTAGGGIQPGK